MIENLNLVQTFKSGMMFNIIRAVDPSTGRNYAVKIIRETSIDNSKHVGFLKNEWAAVRKLEHKNIVKYYHCGKKGKALYIVMDWSEGQNLKTYIGKKLPQGFQKLDRKEMFARRDWLEKTVLQMIDAISYIHAKGILHLDIKPENFLLDLNNKIKLIDFSMAKFGFLGRRRKIDAIAGTPSFISPEQIKLEKPCEASDIYSLGATFYYLLMGRPPYSGRNTNEILKSHLKSKADPVIGAVPGFRKEFGKMLDLMLAKGRDQRLQNLALLKTEIVKSGIFNRLK